MKEEGVDIAWLMVQRERTGDLRQRLITKHAMSIAEQYQGRTISVTGYLVPLNFEGDLVTEFFLLPALGS